MKQPDRVKPLLARGLCNKEIGREMGISHHTAKAYVAMILRELGVKTRAQAAVVLNGGKV